MTPREPSLAARQSATGAIYDLGYRGYDGPRLGRQAAVATLIWASLRAAYGLKRSGRAKIVPWGLAAFLLAPAAVSVAVAALAPVASQVFTYDNYLWNLQVLLGIFVAAQAPELVSSDQRNQVLSLYFSHALQRSDYALAKLGALAAAIFGLAFAPMLLLFVGRILLAPDVPDAFGEELEHLPQVVGSPLIHALPLAALGLAIAAYTPRRAYATGAIIAVFVVSTAVSGILGQSSGRIADLSQLINPFVLADGTRDWLVGGSSPESPVERTGIPLPIFGVLSLTVAIAGSGVVWWRYRGIRA
jgi:ABC-2 type transport system permease protein